MTRLTRHPLAWGAALLALSWLVVFALDPWANERLTDIPVYRELAALFLDGELPYRDVPFEYPPLAWPVLAVPGTWGTGYEDYRLAFGLLMLPFAFAVLAGTRALARRTGGNEHLAVLAVALAPLLAGAILRTRFDLVPVALAVAALAALVSRRMLLGFGLVGLGALTKLFPLAIAPVAVAWLWGRGERREALAGTLALAAVLAVLGACWLALSTDGALDAVEFHAERPVQVESVPASALHVADTLGAATPDVVTSHGSQGLRHPLADEAAALFGALGLGAIALLALGAARAPRARGLVLASLAAMACVAAFGKVLSPQFLAWTVPLLALALAWRLWALAAAMGAATVLTLAEFPARYLDLVAMEPGALWLVGARNVLLLVAIGLAARALWAEASVSAPAGAPARWSVRGLSLRPRPPRR